ncbi:MAG: CaiB/BaiF CoA-transferase family protein [Candidatus Thermoplasmatota archaeon]
MTWHPLDGVKVLDLSRLLPGPFLTQLLSDLGADIIKVEEPRVGDYARWMQDGSAFTAINKGKRSITLDLKAPGAADVVLKLAQRSDVLVESFRPGVLDRLGLPDDLLGRACPKLIRVSLVGYPRGPMRDDVGHDLNYVSLSGILDAQGSGRDAAPVQSAAQVADIGGALYGAVGVLAALHERERTGKGRRVEVALSDAALSMHAVHLQRAAGTGDLPARGEWELSGGIPSYAVYEANDGRFVALAALEPRFWERFVQAVGRPDLDGANLDAARASDVAAVFRASRSRDEWVAFLTKAGVPATPVLDAREALAHPNAARLGGTPGPGSPLTARASQGRAPELGADTDAVLLDAGYSVEEIAAFRSRGVLGP